MVGVRVKEVHSAWLMKGTPDPCPLHLSLSIYIALFSVPLLPKLASSLCHCAIAPVLTAVQGGA